MAPRKQTLLNTLKDHIAVVVGVTTIIGIVAGWVGSWAVGQRDAGIQSAQIAQLQSQIAELKRPINQNPTLEQCVNLSRAQAVAIEEMQLIKADEYRALMDDLGCQNVNSGL
ncbi:hypothetical protein GGQ87_001046 [Brevundimonas alba]|uniref:Uncharacterized protein n=1 Tax=Brevundimonas alba TaxID=74314 RepID=A0A7X5YIW9_9CAUL|nr:hypothetical protein [Brevundimonas alba]NJC40788.1 hypothetical protein [Brevundimonas alba]